MSELRQALEERFRQISLLLYDTSVPPARLDAELKPLLSGEVSFVDPWQGAGGLKWYRLGAAGFHTMFSFHFEVFQVGVQLEATERAGRAIVDGVMNLTPFRWLPAYRLRTILVYDFTLVEAQGELNPRIFAHEEMWSLADMIANTPLIGAVYSKLFRPAFSWGFLAASWLTCRMRGTLPD